MPFAFEDIALRSQMADNSADFMGVLMANNPILVLAGLDPAIHVLLARN